VTPTVDPSTWFEAVQAADGGFPSAAGYDADPNSTALVIDALVATGIDPASSRFVEGGNTPFDSLGSFRFGCAAPVADRGAYWIAPFNAGDPIVPNFLATVQALPAATSVGLIVTGPATFGSDPAAECTTTTTTTTVADPSTTTVPGSPSTTVPTPARPEGRQIRFTG
jgi:hypothetical protein